MNANNMSDDAKDKLRWLENYIETVDECVVAYSGGIDSTVVACVAHRVLGKKSRAVFINTPLLPKNERELAEKWAAAGGFPVDVVTLDPLTLPAVRHNHPDRCYHCKYTLMTELQKRYGVTIIDGSNADDGLDYRPGSRALKELGVVSPLALGSITKQNVRAIAELLELGNAQRPSSPCLATRFPTGTELVPEHISMVDDLERFLRDAEFKVVRVRWESGMARVELAPEEIVRAQDMLQTIFDAAQSLGFSDMKIDPQGYRPS